MPEIVPSSTPRTGRKLAVVAGLIALTLGLSGFFMGLLQTDRAASDAREGLAAPKTAADEALSRVFPEAPRYTELHPGKLHPNKDWAVHLATLVRPDAAANYTPAVLTSEDLAQLRVLGTTRRQYDGAPPVAPHPLDQLTPAACLECHGRPTSIGGRAVPQIVTPHP